jgi:hypothetical protein
MLNNTFGALVKHTQKGNKNIKSMLENISILICITSAPGAFFSIFQTFIGIRQRPTRLNATLMGLHSGVQAWMRAAVYFEIVMQLLLVVLLRNLVLHMLFQVEIVRVMLAIEIAIVRVGNNLLWIETDSKSNPVILAFRNSSMIPWIQS